VERTFKPDYPKYRAKPDKMMIEFYLNIGFYGNQTGLR
jgi:hypothetical protein